MSLGDGASEYLRATIASGGFTISEFSVPAPNPSDPPLLRSKMTGTITGIGLQVTIPHVTLVGSAALTIDTAAEVFTVDVHASGTGNGLTVLDQRIQGDVAARVATTATGERHVLLAISNGLIELTDGTNVLLSLTNGTGIVSVRTSGTAGRIGMQVSATVPGLTLEAALFEVEFNNDIDDVTAQFAGQSLSVPGGPYLQVRVDGLTVKVGEATDPFLTLQANVLVRRVTENAVTVLELEASGVTATIGDADGVHLALRNGAGTLTINNLGIAGTLSGIVELKGVPGVTLVASMSVTFDNTTASPSLSVTGAASLTVAPPAPTGSGQLPAGQPQGPFPLV